MILYHGSTNIISSPEYGSGRPDNDYGSGFYCTETEEMAKEWACAKGTDGFANQYSFDMRGLSVLYLTGGEYHILNWLAILLENRTFSLKNEIAKQGNRYIKENFLPSNYRNYDVIRGYRADDSYFSFAKSFLNNTISLAQLEKAMVLGKMGEQIVLISPKAFSHLKFQNAIPAKHEIYTPKYNFRDQLARSGFQEEKEKVLIENEVYLIDLIRGRWQNDDTRLQRIILR